METGLVAVNQWNAATKWLFRFFAAYFFIYIVPFPIGFLPFTQGLSDWIANLWDPIVYWVSDHILHVGYPITVKPNGSGDTTYNYVQVFIMMMLALLASVLWTVLDRRRKNYDKLLYWVMVYVRYYLAFSIMGYGLYKIIKTQFPFPFYNLDKTYGESSPMGLLWNFMGYSTAYNAFTGMAEFIGGFFLLFRKTTTFGALICFSVMVNVVALNFCFDVPVKLYSSHLMLMSLFIAAPDISRLIRVFFTNKPVPAVNLQPKFTTRKSKISWAIAKVLLIGSVIYFTVTQVWEGYGEYGDSAVQKAPMFGLYRVETFVRNRDTIPPLLTDSTRWKTMSIVYEGGATIRMTNDSLKRFSFTPDTAKKVIEFYSYSDTLHKSSLHYQNRDSSHLVVEGKLKDDSVYIVMDKVDYNKLRLLNRGFHWINEYPYNR